MACSPQLLTAPLMDERAAAIHRVLAVMASLMLPGSHLLIPASPHGRCRALLLLLWATLSWLLPTLALLPMKEGAVAGQREGHAGEAASAAGQAAVGHRQEAATFRQAAGRHSGRQLEAEAAGQAAGGQRQETAVGGTADCRHGQARASWEQALISALRTLHPAAAADVDPWAPLPAPVYEHPTLLWALRWWVLISVMWAAACGAAGN